MNTYFCMLCLISANKVIGVGKDRNDILDEKIRLSQSRSPTEILRTILSPKTGQYIGVI